MPLEENAVPNHVGIIMDGNGRWASARGLARTAGHREGLETAKRIVAHASDIGISTLSLFTFSTENWRRTEEEVNFLMGLIKTHLRRQYDFYREKGIRITHSGDLERLPSAVMKEILLAEDDTSDFDGMRVNLLINYGGRDEIIRAVKRYASSGNDCRNMTEDDLSASLDHPDLCNLDLLIRTGDEVRISNFLIWQAAYAEFFFSEALWPDFSEALLDNAVAHFAKRQRRYGGVPT